MWTCRSRRHASMATGSGPASISTALPEPADSTIASPWPTSQATISHPAGGQPGTIKRTGICTNAATRVAATASRPSPARRTSSTSPAATASNATPPLAPPGHGSAAPGRAPRWSATQTSQRHGQPATCAHPRATGSDQGASAAAANPKTVTGATTGSASTFAGIATRLTRPEIAATIGAVTRCAAVATAIASATPGGT
jgi:hypothetical protein